MIATAEQTTARIMRWQLLEGSERYERRGWVQVDECELTAIGLKPPRDGAFPDADVVLTAWLEHQDPNQPSAVYKAELPDGSRSDAIRWPQRGRA